MRHNSDEMPQAAKILLPHDDMARQNGICVYKFNSIIIHVAIACLDKNRVDFTWH